MDIQAHLSARFDTLQKSVDAANETASKSQIFLEEQARAVKAIRLPVESATGANPFSMGGDVGTLNVSPEQGYVWSLRTLILEGLTRGATPDVIQIRRSNAIGQIIWELNGNQYSQTWGRGEVIIFAGETLFYQSIGTFNSTATIKAYGMAEQVAGEKIAIFF